MKHLCSWVCIVFLMLTCCVGCFQQPPEAKAANDLKRKAMAQYVINTNLLHGAEQQAYFAAEKRTAQQLFDSGMKQMAALADANGKVDAVSVVTWIAKLTADKEAYISQAQGNVAAIQAQIAIADKDMYTALKLDDLVQQFAAQGFDLAQVQSAVDQILAIAAPKLASVVVPTTK